MTAQAVDDNLPAFRGRVTPRPVASETGIMDLIKRIELYRIRQREYRRVRAELLTYSPRELMGDLRMVPADIPEVARKAADLHVEAFVRSNPAYRAAQGWRRREGGLGSSFG
jgi:uncharacterized protein YjiS (DUF1127 family)